MKKIIILIPLLFISFIAWSVNPIHIVYRVDDRDLSKINISGGMYPWEEGQPDDDLTHHFEGESLEGRRSNFVSTTSSLRTAVMHAASLARPNSEEPFSEEFVTYIYEIRPASNFFSVDESLINARNLSPENSLRRERLTRLINDYTHMGEFVAREGFSHDRIIAYAELNGDMLRQYYNDHISALFTQSFWNSRWIRNEGYNHSFDQDTTSTENYANMDTPLGVMNMVINGTQPPVPLSFTCLGVNSQPNTSIRELKEVSNDCSSNQ